MKKLLLAMGVFIVLILGFLSTKGTVEVSADGEHQHCICGTGDLTVGDHTTHTSVTWTAWNGTTALPTIANLTDDVSHDADGRYYFYLTSVVNLGTASWSPGGGTESADTTMGGKKIVLCLNGKTVKSNAHRTIRARLTKLVNITITDCQGTGVIKTLARSGNDGDQGAFLWMTCQNGEFTLYNGTLDMSERTVNLTFNGAFMDFSDSSSFKMYGGTIKGGTYERPSGSGNGVTLYIASSGNNRIYGGTIIGGTSTTRCGGAIHVYNSTLNISGGTITGGTVSASAGSIYVSGTGTVNMTGGTVKDASATNGGLVFLESGTKFNISNATLSGGTATNAGGNVYVAAGGTLTIGDGAVITGGSVPLSGWKTGGNIANFGTVTMNGGTMKDGKASYGGNIYFNGTFNLNGGTVSGGTAANSGGNLWLDGGAKFYMSDGLVTNGVAATNGGNIIAKGSVFQITGGTISNGTAGTSSNQNQGGNLYLYGDGGNKTASISNATIFGGTAYHSGGNITVTSATIAVTLSGCEIYNGKADGGFGGGNIAIGDGCSVTIKNCSIHDGHARAGGNIRSAGTLIIGEDASDTTVISDGVSVDTGYSTNLEVQAGNILVSGGSATINGGTITRGSSTGNGGNVRVNSVTLTMTGGSIENSTTGCNVFVNISATFDMKGGTVKNGKTYNVSVNGYNSCYNGNFLMSGGTVSQNSEHLTKNVSLGGYMKMTGGSIIAPPVSVNDSGVNVFLSNCSGRTAPSGVTDPKKYLSYFEMTGGTISGGISAYYGGNIYGSAGSTIDISGTAVITGGFAANNGGNIYSENVILISGGTVSDGRTTVTNDTTWKNGGNISCKSLTMSGGTISGGKSNAGGNLYLYGNSTISGGTVSGGEALTIYGGNIAMDASGMTLTVNGSALITGGKSKLGGNIRVSGTLIVGTLDATETVTITKGVCESPLSDEKKGGNIYIDAGNAIINNGTISEGKGGSGGNIRIDNVRSLTVNGGVIESPLAGNNIFVNINAEMIMNGGTVRTAPSENICINGYDKCNNGRLFLNGGLIEQTTNNRNIGAYGYVKMTGGTIKGGTLGGSGNGAAVNLSDANREAPSGVTDPKQYLPYFEMTGGEITGGSVGDGVGGNLYVGKNSTAIISGGILRNGVRTVADYSIPNVAVGNGGSLTVTGGTFLTLESTSDHTENSIWITQGGNASISGGYFTRVWARSLTGYITGGTFYVKPGTSYLADGNYAFEGTYSNPDDRDSRIYYYEIAKGYMIETSTMVGTEPAEVGGQVTGGGLYRENETFTLTAYQPVGVMLSGYQFVKWVDVEDLAISLGTAVTYTGTATKNQTLVAMYEKTAASVNYNVTVNAPAFTYSIDGAAAVTGTDGAAISVPAGSSVKITYTGSTPIKAWTNESGKLVSREEVYEFEVYSAKTLTAKTGSDSSATIVFMTLYYQVLSSSDIDSLTEIPAVPTVRGKINGQWKTSGSVIATVSELVSKAEGKTYLEVTPVYEDDPSTYTVTVAYREYAASGTPGGWTSLLDDQDLVAENLSATVKLEAAAELNGKAFAAFMDAAGKILSVSPESNVRFAGNATVYAVYGSAAVEAIPRVTFLTASKVSSNTVSLEALRNIPNGYTLKEQGILFTVDSLKNVSTELEDALSYASDETYKYTSNGRNADDVTGLMLKNITVQVYARAYVIVNDGMNDSIVYSEIVTIAAD